MRKIFVAVAILTILSTIVIVGQEATAQSIPKPAIPQFTVEYVDNSYYIEPTYGIDEYSGETVKTGGGYTYENKSIELKITNQPFTAYNDNDGHHINRYYQIQYKGHFGEEWHYYYSTARLADSDSEYTVESFSIVQGIYSDTFGNLKPGEQVDFRVQALIGYYQPPFPAANYEFIGESSDWSTMQTFTMPGTPEPSVPEFPTITVILAVFIIPLIATILLRKKNPFLSSQLFKNSG